MTSIFDCSLQNLPNPVQVFTKFFESTFEDDEMTETEIEGHTYDKSVSLEEAETLIRIIRKKWFYLQNAVLNDTLISYKDIVETREAINKCLKLIVWSLKGCESYILKEKYMKSLDACIQTLLPLILPMNELKKEIYVKFKSSTYNKEKCCIYQYFHVFQDIQYCLLLLNNVIGKHEQLEEHTEHIIRNMVILSEKAYQHGKSPFICSCQEYFWVILQILSEKALGSGSFWLIFNRVVLNVDSECTLWLLSATANLQGYNPTGKYVGLESGRIKPNYTLLETALKDIVNSSKFSAQITAPLKSVNTLVCKLWLKWAKIEIYQILWEYFSKRLNVSVRTSTNLSLLQLTELIDTIFCTPDRCEQEFELFLSMLYLHLKEYPQHWGKMKGRIYSQLGPNKMKDLDDGGLFNVLLLFVTLTKVNFEEVTKKFLSFIENLCVTKKQSRIVWRFYCELIVRHLRENKDLAEVLPPFIKMLEEASTDPNLFHLVKNFVADLEFIVTSSTNLQLHQWLLINSWIYKYMSTCSHSDLVFLLNVLLNIVRQIERHDIWCDWEPSFKNYVYPALKYSRCTAEVSGTLAAKIVVLCSGMLPDAFVFFNSEAVNSKVTANFLCVVLDNYPNFFMSLQHSNVALQSWSKYCLLMRDGYEELTKRIVKLDAIPDFLKTAMARAKDPLCTFIDHIGADVKSYSESHAINRLCEAFFGQADRWTTQYFNHPDNEAIVLRIYTCVGLALFKLGPLLYNKHKASCPFARLVTSLLLPTELMIGKPRNAYIMESIKKTWHLFFEATVYLNTPDDAFIDRILRELVIRYMPHFSAIDSPMLKCLEHKNTTEVILDKISRNFFKQGTKEAEPSVLKALKLINDFVLRTSSTAQLQAVVNKTLEGLFELIMFHGQHNTALSVVTTITTSPLYSHVQRDFEEKIVSVTEKHLGFNAAKYFQLLGYLSKLVPSTLKTLMPCIRKRVSTVEHMRGLGYDKNLRSNLEIFEANLLKLM